MRLIFGVFAILLGEVPNNFQTRNIDTTNIFSFGMHFPPFVLIGFLFLQKSNYLKTSNGKNNPIFLLHYESLTHIYIFILYVILCSIM